MDMDNAHRTRDEYGQYEEQTSTIHTWYTCMQARIGSWPRDNSIDPCCETSRERRMYVQPYVHVRLNGLRARATSTMMDVACM